jgi:hypothetical protein
MGMSAKDPKDEDDEEKEEKVGADGYTVSQWIAASRPGSTPMLKKWFKYENFNKWANSGQGNGGNETEEVKEDAQGGGGGHQPELKYLTTRQWVYDGSQGAGNYKIEAGNYVRVKVTNQNILGVQLNLEDQTTYYYKRVLGLFPKRVFAGDSYSFVLLPGQSQTFDFYRFANEPYTWIFNICTGAPSGVGSEVAFVRLDFYSTWSPLNLKR